MIRQDAIDAMMEHVRLAVPLGCIIVWPDVSSTIPENVIWARPTIQHFIGKQASLSGGHGEQRYARQGILTIQCFAPVGSGNSQMNAFVNTVIENFETIRNSPIWYRNIRAVEIGKEGSVTHVNVITDFEYEHIH